METMTPRAFLSFLNGRIGAKVLLFNEAGLYKGTYPSRVEDVKGDLVGLSHPLLRGALLPVLRNVELKLKVETEGALYQATVSVARGGPRDGVPPALGDPCIGRREGPAALFRPGALSSQNIFLPP